MLVSSKDAGLQVGTDKPGGLNVHVLQTERRRSQRIKMGNKFLENVVTFEHL